MIWRITLSFIGSKRQEKLYALFDTGSTYSCIREDLAEKIGLLDKLSGCRYFSTASANEFLKVESGMRLDFEINDVLLSDEFMVVPHLSEEVIIGVTTMQKWRIKLDFEQDTVYVDPRVANLFLKQTSESLISKPVLV